MFLRYVGHWKNTSLTLTNWDIEIYDTVIDSIQLNFTLGAQPTESSEGIPFDMPPGIYPSSFDFIFNVREQHEDFVLDLFSGTEERFVVKVFRNGLLYFVGYILSDQSSYLDEYYPYRLNIQCEDGLYKLNSETYKLIAKEIKYLSCSRVDPNAAVLTIPIADCVPGGQQWTLIHHVSQIVEVDEFYSQTESTSTYARYEAQSDLSPGSEWTDAGNGLWIKPIAWENETITSTADPDEYELRRDIIPNDKRLIQEFIHVCISATGLGDYFSGAMYDVLSRWYELQMPNFTSNPFAMERVSELPFKNLTLEEVLMEICRLHYLRVYSCNGRYHIEQLPERARIADVHRWMYNSEGALLGAEVIDLDIDGNNDGIMRPLAGGRYKGLAPLRSVSVRYDVEDGNLLQGVVWDEESQGVRFIGSIPQKGVSHKCEITIATKATSRFEKVQMEALFAQFRAELSRHYVTVTMRIRIVNRTNGNEYWAAQNTGEDEFSYDTFATWGATNSFIRRKVAVGYVPEFSAILLAISSQLVVKIKCSDLPGTDDDIFDMYMNVNYGYEFISYLGGYYWGLQNPGAFILTADSTENMFVSTGSGEGAEVTRRYHVENDVKNTLKIEYSVKFCDSGGKDTSIEVWDGALWVRSRSWARFGVGVGRELIALLVHQIISLRQRPRLIYSCGWNSVLPTAESRISRLGRLFLPMRAQKDTNYDTYSGDFVEINFASTPPEPLIILDGYIPTPNPPAPTGNINFGEGNINVPPVMETDGIIGVGAADQVAITNGLGVHVQAGTIVNIVDPDDFTIFEAVVLSEDLAPADTIMYFDSHVFVNAFPVGSFIVVEPASNFNGDISVGSFEPFYLSIGSVSGDEIHVPHFKNFALLEGLGARAININIDAYRSGNKIQFFDSVDPNYNTYYFDYANGKIKFPTPLNNESFEFKAFYKQ